MALSARTKAQHWSPPRWRTAGLSIRLAFANRRRSTAAAPYWCRPSDVRCQPTPTAPVEGARTRAWSVFNTRVRTRVPSSGLRRQRLRGVPGRRHGNEKGALVPCRSRRKCPNLTPPCKTPVPSDIILCSAWRTPIDPVLVSTVHILSSQVCIRAHARTRARTYASRFGCCSWA